MRFANLKYLNTHFFRSVVLVYALMLVVIAAPSPAHGQEPGNNTTSNGYVWDGTYRRVRVPILVYESLTADMFQQHIETLFYQGYTPISLNDLDRVLLSGERLPPEPVILTFDGGRRDAYDVAFPVLQSHGFTATFFVVTGPVDNTDPAALTWQQIGEMAAAGMHMESNGKTGADLRGASYDFLVYEMLGSVQSLEAYTGIAPQMFAYPGGNYDDGAIDLLRSMNVVRAVTQRDGVFHTNDNRFELARRTVTDQTDVNGLLALLRDNP